MDVHVDVDAQRDVEDGGQQQEGLDEPHQYGVGHGGPHALQHGAARQRREHRHQPHLPERKKEGNQL